MPPTVLIASHRRGFESDPVIDRLRERRVPVFRFNANPEIPGTSITWRAEGGSVSGSLECDERSLDTADIGVGWLQQLPPFQDAPRNAAQWAQWENFFSAWFGLLSDTSLNWLTPPSKVLRASNKMVQLRAAVESGFFIPPTLISNSPTHVRSFGASHLEMVAKSLSTSWVTAKDGQYATFTQGFSAEHCRDEEISFAPAIYQQFLDRVIDYRAVVVGREVYAAACSDQTSEQRFDVRRRVTTGEGYRATQLPSEIVAALRRLLDALGLEYCSADLVEDRSGTIYFLELNVTGSWWWVDELYGGEICASLADVLARGNKPGKIRPRAR